MCSVLTLTKSGHLVCMRLYVNLDICVITDAASSPLHMWSGMVILLFIILRVKIGLSGWCSDSVDAYDHALYTAYLMKNIKFDYVHRRKPRKYSASECDVNIGCVGKTRGKVGVSDSSDQYARFLLVVMALLVIGGVELNPGPVVSVSATELANFLAESTNDVKLINNSGIGAGSLFIKAANHFSPIRDDALGKTLYMRWKRNTGNVQDIFKSIISQREISKINVTEKVDTRVSVKKSQSKCITPETVLNAVIKITQCEHPDPTLAIHQESLWRKLCKELQCKETQKNRDKIRYAWRKHCRQSVDYSVSNGCRSVTAHSHEKNVLPHSVHNSKQDFNTSIPTNVTNVNPTYTTLIRNVERPSNLLITPGNNDINPLRMLLADKDTCIGDMGNIGYCLKIAECVTKPYAKTQSFTNETRDHNAGQNYTGANSFKYDTPLDTSHHIITTPRNTETAEMQDEGTKESVEYDRLEKRDTFMCHTEKHITTDSTIHTDSDKMSSNVEKQWTSNNEIHLPFADISSFFSDTDSNECNVTVSGSNGYDQYEGSFLISVSDWKHIERSPGKYDLNWLIYTIKTAAASVFHKCVIIFKSHRINKTQKENVKENKPTIVYYAKCKFDSCKQFIFLLFVKGEHPVEMRIFSKGVLRHSGEPKTTQLRGYERVMVQEKLSRTKPLSYRLECIQEMDEKPVKDYLNCQDVKSIAVYQKAKSDHAQRKDMAKDDYVDLYLHAANENKTDKDKKLIQDVAYPLKVSMYSILQLKTLLSVPGKKTQFILHIDSTGSVVRPLKDDHKTVYYYSGCVNINGKIIPVMDFISVQHDIGTISSFLTKFITFKNSVTKRKLFSHIVVDYSQALLQAVMFSWNKMTVLRYINIVHRICQIDNFKIYKLVTVHLCCSHFMHMVSIDIAKLNLSKVMRKRILLVMAGLINTTTYNEFKCKVYSLLLIFKRPTLTADVMAAAEKIDNDLNSFDVTEGIVHDDSEAPVNLPVYKSSRFYADGIMLEKTVQEGIVHNPDNTSTNMENPFYCPTFCKLFLTRYMPFAPLWTGIVIKHYKGDKIGVKRFSNSVIENWFNIVKGSVLQRQTGLKVGRFIELLASRITALCKEVCLKIPRSACNRTTTKKTKRKEEKSDERNDEKEHRLDENSEEKWFRRIKKSKTYFQMRFFDSIPTQMRGSTDITTELENSTIKNVSKRKLLEEIKVHELESLETRDTWVNSNAAKKIKKSSSDELYSIENVSVLCPNAIEPLHQINERPITRHGPLPIELNEEDYSSLEGTTYVTDLAIDAVIQGKIDDYELQAEIMYTPASIGSWIIENKIEWSECPFEPKSVSNVRYLFVPYNKSNQNLHWCLTIVDMKMKHVFNFDSLETTDKKAGCNLEQVLHFFVQMNAILKDPKYLIDLEGWKDYSDTVTYPIQRDNHSCGIFVIYYIEQVLRFGISPGSNFQSVDIVAYRRKCQLEISDYKMKNGLFANSQYYYKSLKTNSQIVIGYIKNKNMGRFCEIIYKEDYLRLFGDSWFNDTIVDCCNGTFVNDGQFCFAIGESTFALQERPRFTVTFKPVTTRMASLNIVFIPINLPGTQHYSVVIVDVPSKKISHLDPMSQNQDNNNMMCNRVLRFFKRRNEMMKDDKLDVEMFSIIETNRPLQNDSHNCGAYIVYYISEIARRNSLLNIETSFDPDDFRLQLQRRCLRYSLDMTNVCLVCGKKEKKKHDWCQCQKCSRWIHYPCLNTDMPFTELENSNYYLLCPLCRIV